MKDTVAPSWNYGVLKRTPCVRLCVRLAKFRGCWIRLVSPYIELTSPYHTVYEHECGIWEYNLGPNFQCHPRQWLMKMRTVSLCIPCTFRIMVPLSYLNITLLNDNKCLSTHLPCLFTMWRHYVLFVCWSLGFLLVHVFRFPCGAFYMNL